MSAGPHLSEEEIAAVLEIMGDEGITLKQACDRSDVDYGNVRRRIKASPALSALHADARAAYMETRVQMLAKVADEEPDVARARLKCDNIKWEAARVLPKQYGDKLDLTVSDKRSAAELTTDELHRIAAGGSQGAAEAAGSADQSRQLH